MPDLSTTLSNLEGRLERIEANKRSGIDRAVRPGASPSLVEHVAKGGGIGPRGEPVMA